MGFLTRKIFSKPLGIWLAWAGLFYALIIDVWRSLECAGVAASLSKPAALWEVLLHWVFWLFAAATLLTRRRISQLFAAMVLTLFLFDAIRLSLPIGIVLAPLALVGMLVNTRWFDDHLPRIGWI